MNNPLYLTQKSIFFGSRSFEIQDKRVECKYRRFYTKANYSVPIDEIYPESVELKSISWKCLVYSLGFINFAIFLCYCVIENREPAPAMLYALIVFVFSIGLGFIFYFYSTCLTQIVFISKFDQSALFHIHKSYPSDEQTDAFVNFIHKIAEKNAPSIQSNESSVDKLLKLQHLLEHGSITQDEFEKLKREIIS